MITHAIVMMAVLTVTTALLRNPFLQAMVASDPSIDVQLQTRLMDMVRSR